MTRFNRPSLTLITATVLATVMITAAAVVPIAGASPSRAARATINGHYRIVSTDCYFGSARCERVFDIGQISTTLADPHDKYLRGRVHGATASASASVRRSRSVRSKTVGSRPARPLMADRPCPAP
jgi:hypothetical protein